jgi:Leucine-rich repeat (LRR) protein
MNNKFSLIDNLFANENNNFNALKKIDLKKNRINGYVITSESIKGCPALQEFNIASNKRSAIPLGDSALYGRDALPASSGFSGQVPDFSSCPSLKKCILSGNSITNYVAGSLSNNILLEKLDIGNNDLSLIAAQVLLIDLYINYTSAKRSGVVINIAGNGFNKESLLGDSEARNSAYEVLVSAGWTLTI